MKRRNKWFVLLVAIVVIGAGVALTLTSERRRATTSAPTVSDAPLGAIPPASVGTTGSGGGRAELLSLFLSSEGAGAAGPAFSLPPGLSQQEAALLEQALGSADAEAALIGVLPNPRLRGTACDLLGEIGAERAVQALRGILADPAQNEYHWIASINLWLIQLRLDGLTPQQQVQKIGKELDNLQAHMTPIGFKVGIPGEPMSEEGAVYKMGHGQRLIQRLGNIRMPEGVDVLQRLIAEDLKLWKEGPPIGDPKHWLPYESVVRAFDQIGDARACPLIEAIFPAFIGPGGGADPVRRVWWRVKLKGTPKEQWPEVFTRSVMTGKPSLAAHSLYLGAEEAVALDIHGAEAAVPALERVARDPSLDPNLAPYVLSALRKLAPSEAGRTLRAAATDGGAPESRRAMAVANLGMLADASDLPLFEALATDASQPSALRTAAAVAGLRYRSAEGLRITLAGARVASSLADEEAVNLILARIATFARGLTVGSDDEAFLRRLLEHPSALIQGRAYFALRALGVNIAPPPGVGEAPQAAAPWVLRAAGFWAPNDILWGSGCRPRGPRGPRVATARSETRGHEGEPPAVAGQ